MSATQEPRGPHRVAAFLLSLGESEAASVMRHLEQRVVREVAVAMGELDTSFAQPEAVERLYRNLARELHRRTGVNPADGADLRRRLAASFGPEEAERMLAAIHERRLAERPFAEIESRPPALVARVLRSEPAGSIALVLAHLDPSVSAEVLNGFDTQASLEIVRRMAALEPPTAGALRSVARQLARRLAEQEHAPAAPDPERRLRTIADMLGRSDETLERSVLEGLGDDETVAAIRERMFTWSDLAQVDKRSMQKILASVDTRTLAIALKACPADVEANVLGNLSSRVREMVSEERELAGPTPMGEVLAARGDLLKSVHGLIDSGEFRPARGGQELVQ